MSGTDVSSFGREAGRVASQVTHWTPARWRMEAGGDEGGTRAEAMWAAVRRLADLAARAEDRPARPVPRPAHDGTLVDQLRVMVNDLCVADPDAATLEEAREVVRGLRERLFT